MMRGFGKHILILMVVATMWSSVGAQADIDTVANVPGITISTEVDRAEMYIGDLINYTVTIEYDSTYELIPPPLGANLGAFDVKDYKPDILTRLDDGRFQSKNIFVLSTFTTGDYIIPPIPVVFNLPDGSKKALLSEGVPIKVLSMLEHAGDSVEIKPLKAQWVFQRDLLPYLLWGVPGFLAIILVAILVWMHLRGKKDKEEAVDLRPAWEVAFEQLAMLKQKDYLPEGESKKFYIELTEILRSYYEKMYRMKVLDMTTQEFLEAFEELELPSGLYDRTKDFFGHADLVKFAKLVPQEGRPEADFEVVHVAVEEVRADWDRRHSPQLHNGNNVMDIDSTDSSKPTEVSS